jgi:hypothetical protein
LIQRGGQRASSPCALESQQGVSQSWYPSVSQSVSYPVPTAIGYIESSKAAPGTEAPAAARASATRAPRGAGGPPGPARLGPGGSRGLAAARYLSLRLVNRVRVLGGGHFASGISDAIDFRGPNHSRVVGPRTLADILDPATSNTAESPAKAMRGARARAQSRHDDVLAAVTDSAFSARSDF